MEHQINEEIRDKEVRLIGDDGEQLGILPIQQAQDIAVEKGMDLVKIAPQAKPPVCKIMDYGKFRFDQLKKEKEAKKNQRVVEIKEIRMSPSIDTNDLNTKMRSAMKFLADGNRVKVTVRFRGREMAHTDIGELNTKVKNACRFLQDGNKVKVSVRFRGREVTHASLGQDLLHRFAELCSECSTVEKQPKLEGRQMLMFLAPAKDK